WPGADILLGIFHVGRRAEGWVGHDSGLPLRRSLAGLNPMFTGLVQAKGVVEAAVDGRFTIACPWEPASIALGASICCDGCCLTATAIEPAAGGARFKLDVSNETLSKTTLGGWGPGRAINL